MTLWKRRYLKKKGDASVSADEQGEKVEQTTQIGTAGKEETDWRALYEQTKQELLSFRQEQEALALRRSKEEAYRTLLGQCGIPEKKRGAVLRLCDVDSVELGEEGQILEAEALRKQITAEWSDIIPAPMPQREIYPLVQIQSASPLTKENIMAIRDRDARRAAIMENMELFQ